MASGSLLSMIANPAQADVPAALDANRQRQEVSRQNQARDMAGEILGNTALAGISDLANLDPDTAIQVSKVLGVPADSAGRQKNLIGTSIAVEKLLEDGLVNEAILLLDDEATKIEAVAGPDQAQRLRGIQQALINGDQEMIGNFRRFAQGIGPKVSAKDQAATGKLIAETGKIEAETAGITSGVKGSAPSAIIEKLSTPLKKRATEAFNLAGGGKDGVIAMNAQIALDKTTTQREDVPNLIRGSFPNANPAELEQLQAAVDGAKTVESGLKRADVVRADQRRLVKAKVFQDRVVTLLSNILAGGEGVLGGDLGDVLGSIEGRIDLRVFSDDEASLITDIEEAGNILTADNLDLMTGVLSETDIKIIANLAGGALSRTRTKPRFVKDVTELRDRLASVPVVTVGSPALPEGSTDNGDGTFTLPTGEIVEPE
jgi:hypothetical protein